jgi:hypothetical protein
MKIVSSYFLTKKIYTVKLTISLLYGGGSRYNITNIIGDIEKKKFALGKHRIKKYQFFLNNLVTWQ